MPAYPSDVARAITNQVILGEREGEVDRPSATQSPFSFPGWFAWVAAGYLSMKFLFASYSANSN